MRIVRPLKGAVELQWWVVWFSLLAATFAIVSLGVERDYSPWTWKAALPGVMIGVAGLQMRLALRQEQIAGISRQRMKSALWSAISVVLMLAGGTLIALGCWSLR